MRTLLAISPDPGFAKALQVLVPENDFRVIHHPVHQELPPVLSGNLLTGCIIEADLTDIRPIQTLKALRQANPHCLLFVCCENKQWEWEEEAFLSGADFVFAKPVRGPLFRQVLEKHIGASSPRELPVRPGSRDPFPSPDTHSGPALASPLEILRDFSRILSYSLELKSFIHQFVLKLREIISVNRVAVFLRQPPSSFLSRSAPEGRRLDCVCAVGIPSDLFSYFQLTLDSGIGRAMDRTGQILKLQTESESGMFSPDLEIQREFDLTGCQVAIPIIDRERSIGVALIGGRLTGSRFLDDELQLLFHLMEELGLAIKNNWLHDQLIENHKLVSEVIGQMKSGCLVLDSDLNTMLANPAILEFLSSSVEAGGQLEFSNLPRSLSVPLYEAAHHGNGSEPFLYKDEKTSRSFRVSIYPFQRGKEEKSRSAILLLEDFTRIEAGRKAEMDAERVKLIALIAEKFAHEIRNAIVPLSTHQQLLKEQYDNKEFRDSLEKTMAVEIRRISRCAEQLLCLSRPAQENAEPCSIQRLLEEASEQARIHSGNTSARLEFTEDFEDYRVHLSPTTVRQAFFEIILNSWQSTGDDPRLLVRGKVEKTHDGASYRLEFIDSGHGFDQEDPERSFTPFFSTRTVGMGLGLTVAQKTIQDHGGGIRIKQPPDGKTGGIVEVYFRNGSPRT